MEGGGARGTLGTRESLGEGLEKGLRGNAQDSQEGAGASVPQTRSKKTAPTGAQVGGKDAEGVECEYGASAQSVCRSVWVSAQLDFEVLGHLLGSGRLDLGGTQEETMGRVLFTKEFIFPGLSKQKNLSRVLLPRDVPPQGKGNPNFSPSPQRQPKTGPETGA